MKKLIITLTLIILTLAMAACGGAAAQTAAGNATGNGADAVNGDRQFSMPTAMKLMLGTVKLDQTDLAVDAEQASALLPLWKALRSLGESDTVAQVELDAVVSQIESTMTPEQIKTIEDMDLTMQDMAGVMETLGIEAGNFSGFGEITPEMRATMEAARESGEFPRPGDGAIFIGPGGGRDPGGGQGPGGGFGGAEMDPSARATAIAERGGTRGARLGINSVLLDGIIEFLEAKVP